MKITNRQKQAMLTKNTLFQTAVDLFNDKGYDNVTIEEITSTAGVSKGSFYTYFRSKSDIFIEEFRTIDDYYRSWHEKMPQYETAKERLCQFTSSQLTYVRDIVGIKLLTLLYTNNLESETEKKSEKILIDTSRYLQLIVSEIITYGQQRKEFRADISSSELARLYNRAMRSMFLDWAISNASFDLVEEGIEFCKIMLCPSLLSN